MKRCHRIWAQLRRSQSHNSRTWKSQCPSGSVPTVGGTWCSRRRGKETGEENLQTCMMTMKQIYNIATSTTVPQHTVADKSFCCGSTLVVALVTPLPLSSPSTCSKYLTCVGYPACKTAVWFPDTVLDVSRDESVCPTCQPAPVNM